jgi:uncharacterized integral membrane protein
MADPAPRPRSRQRPSAGLIGGGLVAILVLWFALVNRQRVKIDFILFERDARLIYIILGSAILGAIAGVLVRHHRRRERRRDRRD